MTTQTDTDALVERWERKLWPNDAAVSVGNCGEIRELLTHLTAQAAQIAALTERVRVLREALRECRQAIAHHNHDPRRNVREIVDRALVSKDADQ